MLQTCFVVMENDPDPRGRGLSPVFVLTGFKDRCDALVRAAELYRGNGHTACVKGETLEVVRCPDNKQVTVRLVRVSMFR